MKKVFVVTCVVGASLSAANAASACGFLREDLQPLCKAACQVLPDGFFKQGCLIGAPAPQENGRS